MRVKGDFGGLILRAGFCLTNRWRGCYNCTRFKTGRIIPFCKQWPENQALNESIVERKIL
jgi:hypothetical protein